MLLHEILAEAARKWPDRPAVWCNNEWRSYARLREEAAAVAAQLRELGVQPGDRVAILLDNSFDYVRAHFGVLEAGAVDVSLNTGASAEDLRHLLADSEARVLIAARRLQRQWLPAIAGIESLQEIIVDQTPAPEVPGRNPIRHSLAGLNGKCGKVPAPARIDIDLASLVYTSGSTGKPKGVMLSHLNLLSNMRSIVSYLRLNENDRVLAVLPFHYIYGRSLLYTQFLSGGGLVLDNRFAFPVTILQTMQELKVTGFAGVPSTYSILLNKTDLKNRKFPDLRFVTQAGGGMAPALQKAVVETFAPAELFVMYGTTEAAPRLTYVEPGMLTAKWGSIGKAIPNVEVVVVDGDGKRVPRGTQGEIAARGANIMMGYWKDEEGTAAVMRNGYYCTGDLGFEDEDGYFFVTGRARDIIKVGGNRVSAKEIEDVLLELPGMVEAAVIGLPDEILGEAIKALFVTENPALTAEVVLQHLQRRLPPVKHPKWIEPRTQLPKSQAGKILKPVLLAEARNELNVLCK